MALRYQFHCGECRFHTSWSTESGGEDALLSHYLDRHPGIPPGGAFRMKDTGGCLGALILLFAVPLSAVLALLTVVR